jgi:hypothetical protein
LQEDWTMAHQAGVEDKKFIQSFEAFEIAPDDFDHRSHIRMAYVYLCEHDTETTCRKVRQALCRFLSHVGIEPSSKYHETLTQAWILAVRHFMVRTPDTDSASEFIDANPELLDTGIMMTHYSKNVLFSDMARSKFVEPNLAPIPRH